jgi:hypothetical protein
MIAGGLIFAMMGGMDALLYGIFAAGAIGSFVLGQCAIKDDVPSRDERLRKFGKGWLLVIGLAALSLINGKWEPMVFFALASAISSGLFWLGSRSSS